VTLDLVELLFKEQYFNGNDMLRLKKYMVNTCVYLKKSIEFCGMRCSVREMWAPNGDIVTCGYISEKTRLVFRAQSAMCTIYIQMSRGKTIVSKESKLGETDLKHAFQV
jgi:hypothetical protein